MIQSLNYFKLKRVSIQNWGGGGVWRLKNKCSLLSLISPEIIKLKLHDLITPFHFKNFNFYYFFLILFII